MIHEDFKKYQELKDQKYIVVPNFMSKEDAHEYYKIFRDYCVKNDVPNDSQVEKCQSIFNFTPFVQLLCDYTKFVSDTLGVNVVPTYAFGRTYLNDSYLKNHRDFESCEISVSLHLYGDKEWPLIIDGQEIYLNPGEAVIYWGFEFDHWRDRYDGEEFTQVFLHYVRTYGDNKRHLFDYPRQKWRWEQHMKEKQLSKNRFLFT
jgi:hypothetical protein